MNYHILSLEVIAAVSSYEKEKAAVVHAKGSARERFGVCIAVFALFALGCVLRCSEVMCGVY